jgi:hypothetical protein
MPQPSPGLPLGPGFCGRGTPAFFLAGAGLRGPQRLPLAGWPPRATALRGRRQRRELGPAQQARNHLGGRGEVPQEVCGGRAAVGKDAPGACGERLGSPGDELSGPGAPRAGGQPPRRRQGGLPGEGQPAGQRPAGPRPVLAGQAQDAPDNVPATPGTICVPSRARPGAGAVEPCPGAPGFFLGEVVEGQPEGRRLVNPGGAMTDARRPPCPAALGARPAEKDRDAGKMLERGRAGPPPLGGEGVRLGGQDPAPRQAGKGLPGRGPEKGLAKDHDKAATG